MSFRDSLEFCVIVYRKIEKYLQEEKGCAMALFCFPFPENSRFVPSGEKQKIFMV